MKLNELIYTMPLNTEISVYLYGSILKFRGTVDTFYNELKYYTEINEKKVTRIKAIDYDEIKINIE